MEKVRILIVEDCKITAKIIKSALISLGYEVVDSVATGEDAIASCFHQEPDLILMDIEIEGPMNGIETADKIRSFFDVPIIYLTALSDGITLSRAKTAGGFAYLIKPFRKMDLHANIEMTTYAHRMKKKAKENEVKYRNIFDNMFDGFIYCKIVFDETNKPVDYILLEVNDAFEKLIGIKKENILGKTINEILQLEQYNHLLKDIEIFNEAVYGEKVHIKEYFLDYVGKWFSITVSKLQDGYLSILITDITERKTSEEKLKFLTFHDALTGLYNRTYFQEELKRYDVPRQLPLSVIIGDINGLKLANDVFGHNEGDKLLIRIAEKLKQSCRVEDLIARWGGDEFVILLPKTNEEEAKTICQRITNFCKQETDCLVKTSIALGYSTKVQESQDIQRLLKEAEDKMYKNKLISSKRAHELIISSLKESLIEKTHETKEHIEEIKENLLLVGSFMSLSLKLLSELALLAEFHDIGKIAIPKEILNKTTALTEKEREIIKQHPVTGYRIASSSRNLMPIAEAILLHHEWWDGSGYPLGVKREEIPITARLLAIVEAYYVMLHGRIYKKPLKPEEALQEIRDYAGRQFDPALVNVFIEVIQKKNKSH
ncbi:sensory box protein [Clostridium aceticum]|uniref:Stage 0 sporulation protein A homolog n=1 Tax=Clostridium aceticum TaxID=84022 RepID=A0A0G3W9J7_9CLOT|nr:HD domain-containing phosphohydrolase [Clostridium aceticum]AKL94520.1 sensory box protein [Clostridium aceticum]